MARSFLKTLLLIVLAFSLGIGAATIYADLQAAITAPTYDESFELPTTIYSSLTGKAIARATPGDHINQRQIYVTRDKVVLDIKDAILARFTDTASMDPVFDEKANALELPVKNEEDVNEGDIIAYSTDRMAYTAVHRVIKKSSDELGTYFILKGDNNAAVDPEKVRLEDIKSVVVAIVY